jgi:outer membrane protein assembly factor BamB
MYIVRLTVLFALVMFSVSCTQVDNYMLGKENLPKPKKLQDIKSKVKMKKEWSAAIGKKDKSHTYLKLKPVIIKDTLYAAETNGSVQAVNKKNGHILWTTQIDHSIISGPIIENDAIVVGTDAASIVLLNRVNGKVLWTAHLSEDALSKSLILKDKVIVKTIDGNLYAFDLSTGNKLWMTEHGAPNLILRASSSPVIMGDFIIVGFSDGKLDAIDVNDGRLVWQRSIAYATGASDVERLIDIDADPIVHNNVVYVASYQGYIGALSLTDGQFVWNKPGSVYKNMTMANGTLYVVDSKDIMWAFDEHSGRVKWKQASLKHHGLTEPVLMGNKLLVGDKTGYLHVVSIANGELIGRTQLGSSINVSPVVSNDIAYTMHKNGSISATKVS